MGIFNQTGTKGLRIASAQSGSVLGLQQVLELILAEQVKQTALLERIASQRPGEVVWAGSAGGTGRGVGSRWSASVTGSPPPNS